MKYFISACLALWAGAAAAYDWPARYSVIGIASGDLLPIYSEQNTESGILAGYVFDAKSIEVIEASEDGMWGLVNVRDLTGWVAMANLLLDEDDVPVTLACFGSNPSWNLNMSEDKDSTWGSPEDQGKVTFAASDVSGLAFDGTITLSESSVRSGQSIAFTAALTPETCTYPDRDNKFGLKADVLLKGYAGISGPGADKTVSGCCSLQP